MKVLVDADVEKIIRRLSIEPILSVCLNACSEITVKFQNGRVVKRKSDLYFTAFLCILNKVKYLEKIDEEENDEDRRAFVPDANHLFYLFGFKSGDRFKSVSQSGVECFTRLS